MDNVPLDDRNKYHPPYIETVESKRYLRDSIKKDKD
jgi:hypothetical protein